MFSKHFSFNNRIYIYLHDKVYSKYISSYCKSIRTPGNVEIKISKISAIWFNFLFLKNEPYYVYAL